MDIKNFFSTEIQEVMELFKKKAPILEKLSKEREYTEKWYFSDKGKAYYDSIDVKEEKAEFFYIYLQRVAISPECYEALSKLACVMVTISEAHLDFSSYPEILDGSQNPLIAYVKNNAIKKDTSETEGALCIAILEALKGFSFENGKEYRSLTPYSEENSDMYMIERDIIALFSLKDKGKTSFAPFVYRP